MPRFLILRLDGPMQAWGTHTYEDFRPSNNFPTRSALLGLLGACLGLERHDVAAQTQLAGSVEFSVRLDNKIARPGRDAIVEKRAQKMPDFHTVLNARKVDGSKNKFPIVSRREYLFDAAFTVAVSCKPDASIELARIAEAVRQPCYTPSLGRRSCPIARPLFDSEVDAPDGKSALNATPVPGGLIYSESVISERPLRLRDVPIQGRSRQFATRMAYLHTQPQEPPCS